jgi:hypothetical protein
MPPKASALLNRDVECVHDAFHVADSENLAGHGVSGMIVRFAFQGRRVVGPDGPVETRLVIDLEHSGHVGRAVVMKCFPELLPRMQSRRLGGAICDAPQASECPSEYTGKDEDFPCCRDSLTPDPAERWLTKGPLNTLNQSAMIS